MLGIGFGVVSSTRNSVLGKKKQEKGAGVGGFRFELKVMVSAPRYPRVYDVCLFSSIDLLEKKKNSCRRRAVSLWLLLDLWVWLLFDTTQQVVWRWVCVPTRSSNGVQAALVDFKVLQGVQLWTNIAHLPIENPSATPRWSSPPDVE